MLSKEDYVLPEMHIHPENRLWIYGTGEIARSYYEQIGFQYGEHIVKGFINALGQPATFMGKRVVGLSEKLEIENHDRFLVATRYSTDIAVATLLYYYDVPREHIICHPDWIVSPSPGRQPVLIHQFGKVGSTSIYRELRRLNLEVFHSHFLQDQNLDKWIRNIQDAGAGINFFVLNNLCLGKWALRRKWDIISGVRDPISRNISWFFENLYYIIPDYQQHLNKMDPDRLADRWAEFFIREFPHEEVLNWFDMEMRDTFGIDVFAHPFDRSKGYGVYEGNGHRLLVLQFEQLQNLAGVIRDFLRLPEFRLNRENVGESKDYGNVYKRFIERIRFDDALLDRMYNNRFSRYFYTDEDIETFRRKWSKRP